MYNYYIEVRFKGQGATKQKPHSIAFQGEGAGLLYQLAGLPAVSGFKVTSKIGLLS